MLSPEVLINAGQSTESALAAESAARGNRRRLRVFLAAFAISLLAGLIYTYSRPAEYRAQTRLAVRTASVVTALPTTTAGGATVTTSPNEAGAGGLQAEIGILTSRPLIESALAVLRRQGIEMPEFGADPAQGIQSVLLAETLPGSNQIGLSLTGAEAGHLAAFLNTLSEVYARKIVESYAHLASSEGEALRQELAALEQRLGDKRKALEEFRQSADIFSGERDENSVIARIKGQSASLNSADEKVAQAEGRVRSVRDSLAAGKQMVRSRDNPTMASLEARASQLREALREQERTYTAEFLAMDPNARGMRSRLADLERQIAEQTTSAGQIALSEAEADLAAARQAQRRLQQQMAQDRSAAHGFSRRFSAYKSMQDELAQLEASRRSLAERVLRTETSERSRMPSVQIVEAATPPREPWRPNYSRDAAISVGVALALGLLLMGLVELFNRSPAPSNAPVILPQQWISVGPGAGGSPALGGATAGLELAAPSQGLLPRAAETPRELTQFEVAELLRAAPSDDRTWIGLLLSGATPDEIRGIAADDVVIETASVALRGPSARSLRVPATVLDPLTAAAERDWPDEEFNRRLLCAAHDAAIEAPATVTVDALRHTCIAYLIREGLRFSELDRIVGAVPAAALAAYTPLSPSGRRRSADEVEPLMSALAALDRG